jgi:hypothetical protein
MNFLDPPSRLFGPRMLAEVLFAGSSGSPKDTCRGDASLGQMPQVGGAG